VSTLFADWRGEPVKPSYVSHQFAAKMKASGLPQQRLVPVRLFYDFLMDEGGRESNPVGRGRYTPGR
jgi:site-specific recombinase XerD